MIKDSKSNYLYKENR